FLLSNTPPNGTILITGWSLCYEMYFYILFALLLFLPRDIFLIGVGVVFAAGLAIRAANFGVPPWVTVGTDPLLLEFYAGALIAHLFIRGYCLTPRLALFGIIASIAAVAILGDRVGGDWQRILYWGGPSAIILISAISLERTALRVPKILITLG